MKKIIIGCVAFITLACGWDWDTIQMEKQAFPQIHELITGKFLRHSQELYYWRIQDRKKRLRTAPDSLNLYDDLAMAYDKTGESMKAVETMLEKENKKPGLYETYANLGLFYMHAGDMKNGVVYVEKALKVNPNAHFGREKYQLYLGRYILTRMRGDTLTLPLTSGPKTGFYDYLRTHCFKHSDDFRSEAHFKELSDAIKGVSGMMTFANYRSPVLLEALADLLLHTNSVRGSGHLASRAYLKAAFETEGITSKAYYKKAELAREFVYADRRLMEAMDEGHLNLGPGKKDTLSGVLIEYPIFRMNVLEMALKLEVQDAERWFDSLRRDEMLWIREKKDPDKEFAKKYYEGKNLKNIALDQNQASKKKGEIDNTLWLNQNLTRPVMNKGIPAFAQLPDSVRAEIDELYKEEAKVEEPATDEEKKPATEKKNDSGSPFAIWLILLIPLLGMMFYLKFKRRKH